MGKGSDGSEESGSENQKSSSEGKDGDFNDIIRKYYMRIDMRKYDGYEYTSYWTRYKTGVNEYMAAAICLVAEDIPGEESQSRDEEATDDKETTDEKEASDENKEATDDSSEGIPVLDEQDEKERELIE